MARRSSATATSRARCEVLRRRASFTVSLIVVVPNSARAAPSAASSRSTRCFATSAAYTAAHVYRRNRATRSTGSALQRPGGHRKPILNRVGGMLVSGRRPRHRRARGRERHRGEGLRLGDRRQPRRDRQPDYLEVGAALAGFVFSGRHLEIMRQRRQWFHQAAEATTALWWVPGGHRRSTAEAEDRVRQLSRRGPSTDSFMFRKLFPAPGQTATDVHSGDDWLCPA